MPLYRSLGEIPPKRHTAFRKPDGSLYYEHLMGNGGFRGIQSILYSLRRPTTVLAIEKLRDVVWHPEPESRLGMRHLRAHRLEVPGTSATVDRVPLLFNSRVGISIARPRGSDDFFYRNAMGDEVVYVTRGRGTLESQFGDLDVREGDYVVIPRGILHRWKMPDEEAVLFVVESREWVRTPRRYRNEMGQHLEHSPFCERDIRTPDRLETKDETGEFTVVVKKAGALHRVVMDHHPLDTVGWDGFYYPWALSIHDFEPITGRIHQPPPVHQTFETDHWVLCSFVPRLYDWHPEAIPAPYNHSNVGTDEVLYYCSDEFMSRSGVEQGSITLHPDGLTHGPQPGKIEASIGKKETKELAVMIDTTEPLSVALQALDCEDGSYGRSWLES